MFHQPDRHVLPAKQTPSSDDARLIVNLIPNIDKYDLRVKPKDTIRPIYIIFRLSLYVKLDQWQPEFWIRFRVLIRLLKNPDPGFHPYPDPKCL